jgi:hypothetical protein
MPQPNAYFPGTVETGKQQRGETAESQMPISTGDNYLGEGIMKTVTTLIGTGSGEDSDDACSEHTTAHKSVVQ